MRTFPLLAAALGMVALAGSAQAHTKVVASTPAANTAVAPMKKVSITFNEKTVPAFSGADIVMTAMPGMAAHKPMKLNGMKSGWSNNGKTLTLTAARPFPNGTYQVAWHAAAQLFERFVSWVCGLEHLREAIPYPRMLYRMYP